MITDQQFIELQRKVDQLSQRRITQEMLVPKAVKQRAVEAWIVFSGLAADLPDGTTEVQAYFATDTNTLYLWNGTAWKSEVFS